MLAAIVSTLTTIVRTLTAIVRTLTAIADGPGPIVLPLPALQDLPFCALNTILLDRAVRRRNDPTLLSSQRLCSAEYNINFLMLLLVLLTSVGMLVYKAMHLLPLPRVWAEHKRLAAEAAELEECSAAIDRRMGALASEDSGPSMILI